MVSSTVFEVHRVMASGFVATEEFSPSKALRQILKNWPDVYDGEMTSFPLPPDVPPDVPSVLLSSKNGAWRLEISRARVNVLWLRREEGLGNLANTLAEFADRLATIFEESEAGVGRLAAVVTRQASIEDPGGTLARQFCRDEFLGGPLNRPEGFELHAHKRFQLLPQLTVNSWIRIKTAKGASQEYRYVTVEQDINTLGEELESRRFSRDETVAVFDAASGEVDAILEMYFPPGG